MINRKQGLKCQTVEFNVSVTCDRCKRTFSFDEDFLETQEFHFIRFTGGYASVFGDESDVECDLCQTCLKVLIGDFARVKD